MCVGSELRGGVRGSREAALVDLTLGTGVSTRTPIAWIALRVDEGGRKVDSERWSVSGGGYDVARPGRWKILTP